MEKQQQIQVKLKEMFQLVKDYVKKTGSVYVGPVYVTPKKYDLHTKVAYRGAKCHNHVLHEHLNTGKPPFSIFCLFALSIFFHL